MEFLGFKITESFVIALLPFVAAIIIKLLELRPKKKADKQRAVELLQQLESSSIDKNGITYKLSKQQLLSELAEYNASIEFFEKLNRYKHPEMALARYRKHPHLLPNFPQGNEVVSNYRFCAFLAIVTLVMLVFTGVTSYCSQVFYRMIDDNSQIRAYNSSVNKGRLDVPATLIISHPKSISLNKNQTQIEVKEPENIAYQPKSPVSLPSDIQSRYCTNNKKDGTLACKELGTLKFIFMYLIFFGTVGGTFLCFWAAFLACTTCLETLGVNKKWLEEGVAWAPLPESRGKNAATAQPGKLSMTRILRDIIFGFRVGDRNQ